MAAWNTIEDGVALHPCRVRTRGPIKEPDHGILKAIIPKLADVCDVDKLLELLFSKGVFDKTDVEMVKKKKNSENTRAAMVELLVILLDCGEDALELFKECLQESNHTPALQILGCSKTGGNHESCLSAIQETASSGSLMNITLLVKELRVVLVGKTGVGKSLLGNSLLLKKLFESRMDAGSITSVSELGTRIIGDHTHLIMVDTPGIFDTRKTNAETVREVVKCIGLTSPGPHVFIFVLSITRFTDEEWNTFQCFKDTFGESVMDFAIVVFTCKDSLEFDERTLDDYIAKAPQQLQNIVKECDGRAAAINNLAKPDERRQDVEAIFDLIQDTITKNNDRFYTGYMYEAAERVLKEKLLMLDEEKHKKERELEEKAKQMEENAKQKQIEMEDIMKREREENQRQKDSEMAEYQQRQKGLEEALERSKRENDKKSANIWKNTEKEFRRFIKKI